MAKLSFKNFTLLTSAERDLVLEWRNADRIRCRMTNSHRIAPEEHERFVASLAGRSDCSYFLFLVDEVPVGVLDFLRIDSREKTCEPGLYIGDERYLGMGFPLYFCAFAHAFDDMGCELLCGSVRKDNPVSYGIGKRIFGGLDTGETETERRIEFRRSDWLRRKKELWARIKDNFKVEGITWS